MTLHDVTCAQHAYTALALQTSTSIRPLLFDQHMSYDDAVQAGICGPACRTCAAAASELMFALCQRWLPPCAAHSPFLM